MPYSALWPSRFAHCDLHPVSNGRTLCSTSLSRSCNRQKVLWDWPLYLSLSSIQNILTLSTAHENLPLSDTPQPWPPGKPSRAYSLQLSRQSRWQTLSFQLEPRDLPELCSTSKLRHRSTPEDPTIALDCELKCPEANANSVILVLRYDNLTGRGLAQSDSPESRVLSQSPGSCHLEESPQHSQLPPIRGRGIRSLLASLLSWAQIADFLAPCPFLAFL